MGLFDAIFGKSWDEKIAEYESQHWLSHEDRMRGFLEKYYNSAKGSDILDMSEAVKRYCKRNDPSGNLASFAVAEMMRLALERLQGR